MAKRKHALASSGRDRNSGTPWAKCTCGQTFDADHEADVRKLLADHLAEVTR